MIYGCSYSAYVHCGLLSRLSSDMAGASVCPPVAIDSGMGLLCRLFELWGKVPAGFIALTEWLLGDEEGSDEAVADKASSLVSICHLSWSDRSRVPSVSMTSEQIHIDNLHCYTVVQENHKPCQDICKAVEYMYLRCLQSKTYHFHWFLFLPGKL